MEKSLSAKEICAIIKSCASSGVRSLTLGELSIEFGPLATEITSEPQWPDAYKSISPSLSEGPLSDRFTPADLNIDSELLAVEDPAAWEKIQLEEK